MMIQYNYTKSNFDKDEILYLLDKCRYICVSNEQRRNPKSNSYTLFERRLDRYWNDKHSMKYDLDGMYRYISIALNTSEQVVLLEYE